ncbi:MAG TPA: hypothetical protein VNG33_10125 [Polyangiaceae bacterium]|nr:hypothetical protein [Polyangiaceae bacterium]
MKIAGLTETETLWAAGAAVGLFLLFSKRPQSAIDHVTATDGASPFDPTVPAEFRTFKPPSLPGYSRMRASDVPASIRPKLPPLLASPLGTVTKLPTDGRDIAAVIEPHFHEPGGPVKPWGWHKGVSLYERKGANA